MWSDSIKPGDKLKIIEKTEHYSRKTYFSRIGDILDSHRLLVYTPISEGNFIRLPLGEEYSMLFYTKDGLLKANGKILEYCVQNNVDLMEIEINEYQRIQRRLFYRLNFSLNFTFTRKTDLAEGISTDDVPVYKGVVRDISGGGLCFVSDVMLMQNEHIICELCLNCSDVTVEGRVRGIQLLDDFEDGYVYRIEFFNIESALQEQIVKYVFCIQREIIKKMKRESESQESMPE